MLGEEPQRWKAEMLLSEELGWLPFCRLLGRAEAEEGEDAGMVYLLYRRLHRGVAPAYRSLLLSASGGSVFAAALAAPPGLGQYSVGP